MTRSVEVEELTDFMVNSEVVALKEAISPE